MGTQCRTPEISRKMAISMKNTMKQALLNKIKTDDVPISIILGKTSFFLEFPRQFDLGYFKFSTILASVFLGLKSDFYDLIHMFCFQQISMNSSSKVKI